MSPEPNLMVPTGPKIAFKLDRNRHGNATPFRRNDALLKALPIGVMVFSGSGI